MGGGDRSTIFITLVSLFFDRTEPHSTLPVLAPNKSESIEWNYAQIPQRV